MKNIVIIDTTVTGAGAKSRGGILAGGDCHKAIQPEPLDAAPRTTLASGGMATPFLLPNGECIKFRLAVRPPFSKGDEHWGSHPQMAGQSPQSHPVGRNSIF